MSSQRMQYLLPVLLIAGSCLAASGCMTSPTNNQHLGYYYGSTSKPVTAGGFVDKPNAVVTVEALDWRSGRWVTIATCRSSRSPYRWDGRDWYYWQAAPTRLTARQWSSYWGEAEARLRSVSNGTSLFTFDEWNWTATSTIGDVAEGVNGQEVSIYGWQFEIDP
jgi:hypothetical protein